MKLRLLQALIIAFVLACGFTAGYHWPHKVVAEDDPEWDCQTMGNRICGPDEARSRAYEQGITEMTWYVEDCTLADAHAQLCTIPCGGDQDCVEKNGSRDAY